MVNVDSASKTVVITGGAGFIGSAVVRHLIEKTDYKVINFDKLTYAANLESLKEIKAPGRYFFIQADIENRKKIDDVLDEYQPDLIMNLAAETHVDRSIDNPEQFVRTNVVGTFHLLEACRNYWSKLSGEKKTNFRLHHVSTDEVFGDLEQDGSPFTETTPYTPSSPYSASKASSDHLMRAWYRTYRLPIVLTNCSNNYGPFQFPEKLIPKTIMNALNGAPLPIYANGEQVRDWLFVEDHAQALIQVATHGEPGQSYNIGGCNEIKNIEVVKKVCAILEELRPVKPSGISTYDELITFVADRPGHDSRYAIDNTKISTELGWQPQENFESGLRKTVIWYLQNTEWLINILNQKNR